MRRTASVCRVMGTGQNGTLTLAEIARIAVPTSTSATACTARLTLRGQMAVASARDELTVGMA